MQKLVENLLNKQDSGNKFKYYAIGFLLIVVIVIGLATKLISFASLQSLLKTKKKSDKNEDTINKTKEEIKLVDEKIEEYNIKHKNNADKIQKLDSEKKDVNQDWHKE